MARCSHSRGEFHEILEASHVFSVKGGVLDIDCDSEIGNIKGYHFHCFLCGKWWSATAPSRFKPLWLKKIATQINQNGVLEAQNGQGGNA